MIIPDFPLEQLIELRAQIDIRIANIKDEEMIDRAKLMAKLFKEENAHHAEQYNTDDDA